MPVIVLLIAVVAWQVEMAIECAMHCIHKPRPAATARTAPSKPPPVARPSIVIHPPVICRGPECPTPSPSQPSTAPPSSRR